MNSLIVLAVTLACAAADVSHLDAAAPIVRSDFDISPEGQYQYAYETGNGIYGQEQGTLKKTNSEYPSIEVKGAYKYTSPEGIPIELSYTADENGYQPVGSHLPVPPEIPEAIARSLRYIAEHPSRPEQVPARAVASLFG